MSVSVGAEDLKDATNDVDRVILVGITCGLSAPYVAGQIDYAMQQVILLNLLHTVKELSSLLLI